MPYISDDDYTIAWPAKMAEAKSEEVGILLHSADEMRSSLGR